MKLKILLLISFFAVLLPLWAKAETKPPGTRTGIDFTMDDTIRALSHSVTS